MGIFYICPWMPPIKTSLYINFYTNIIMKVCCFISVFFDASVVPAHPDGTEDLVTSLQTGLDI